MNASLKRKLIAGFILAFLAGGAAGAFLTLHQSQRWRHHPHSLSERMRDRIKSELDLTPEQFAKVRPILDRAANQLEKIRIESGRNVRQVLAETNRALEPELTDTQRTRLENMQKMQHRVRGMKSQRHRGLRAGEKETATPPDRSPPPSP